MDDLKRAAAAARMRTEAIEVLSIHLNGLTAVVRALIHTHPNRAAARAACDQLIGQMLAHPGYLVDSDYGIILRDYVETVFQLPVEL